MSTRLGVRWIAVVGAMALGLPVAMGAQGFGFGGPREELELVDRFDKNKDKRLDAAERRAAREAARAQGGGFRRFGGFGFGPGAGDAPTPGRKLAPSDVRSYPASVGLYDLTALRTRVSEVEVLEAKSREDADRVRLQLALLEETAQNAQTAVAGREKELADTQKAKADAGK